MENLEPELGPKLKKLKQMQHESNVPQGYFEQMEAKVFERLEAEGALRSKPAKLSHVQGGRYKWLMAASLVLVCTVGGWFAYQNFQPATPALATADISPEDAQYFIQKHLDAFEADELIADVSVLPDPLEDLEDSRLRQIPEPQKKPEPKSLTPTELEMDLLDELTDEDLEDLL